MPKLGELTVPGKSGTKYKFDAYPLHTVWTRISAVYIVTHRDLLADGGVEHVCIHLGESENLQEMPPPPSAWMKRHRANCICIFQEAGAERRRQIIEDILDASSLPT
jgi:hypothetical protein